MYNKYLCFHLVALTFKSLLFMLITLHQNCVISCYSSKLKAPSSRDSVLFSSVAQSCLTLCHPMDCSMPGFPVHHQLPELAQTSWPTSQWCHPTISSSVILFSSCLQAFPASGSFPMGQFFASDGQSIGVSASASVLPMSTQDWSPLGWTGLQSKGLSRVFSNSTVQKYQFFGIQLSL